MNYNITILLVIICSLLEFMFACPSNCLFCILPQVCMTCMNQFHLTTSSKCLPKSIQNCRVYLTQSACAICEASFKLQNNICVGDTSGCLIRDVNGICQQCWLGTSLDIQHNCAGIINCQTPSNDCQQCKTGYKLTNSTCVYAKDDCDTISKNGLCIKCRKGFILNGFQCINSGQSSITNNNINLIQFCSLYSRTSKKCYKCMNGYQVLNNICRSSGEVYLLARQISAQKLLPNSKISFMPNQRQKLSYSKRSYSSNTKDDILDVPQINQDVVSFQALGIDLDKNQNCLIMNTNHICQLCAEQYYLVNGACKKSTQVCLAYDHTKNTYYTCKTCNQRFLLLNGQCIDLNCDVFITRSCSKCKNGYLIDQQSFCYDPNCLNVTNGLCNSCKAGYNLSLSKLCLEKPALNIINSVIDNSTSLNTNVSSSNRSKSQSNTSQITNTITTKNESKLSTQIKDPNCLGYSVSNVCKLCNSRSFLSSGKCVAVAVECKTFLKASGSCTSCQSGYVLYSQDNSKTFICLKKLTKIDPNCLLASKDTYCIRCRANYFITNGVCLQADTICKTFQTYGGKCLTCYDGYYLDTGKCLTCLQGYIVKDNICVLDNAIILQINDQTDMLAN